ncbi:MAG: tRNA 2-thiouridine(34) synthase MnmA [Acidobacteriota bacterium]
MSSKREESVVVAMSGGVDSSMAAFLLKEKGFKVIGITMDLFSLDKEFCLDESLRSCCGKGALSSANLVAVKLGIPHYVVDFKQIFEETVISNFIREYSSGRTPNPCIRCNRYLKFELLWERAKKLGVSYIATGHHSRIIFDTQSKCYRLKKGKDRRKDQSYFLYNLGQRHLEHTLFPIGEYTKEKVRKMAEELELPVSKKPESQEICFIPDKDHVQFLKNRIPDAFRPGAIEDPEGKIIGEHRGIPGFTIGQRRGLGISSPYPLYVLNIKPETNTLVVGPEPFLYKRKLVATSLNFTCHRPDQSRLQLRAKVRYRQEETKVVLSFLGEEKAEVEFEKPQRAITPGQAVVFYDQDDVVGGGIIKKTT